VEHATEGELSSASHDEAEAAEGSASDEADAARAQSEAEGEPAGDTDAAIAEFPALDHAEFHWFPNAATSLFIVGAGIVAAFGFCWAYYGRKDRRLVGLTDRIAPARWAYTFVANKYYLDALYEGVIVKAIAHPIAKAAYWINQNLIDGIVNGAGIGTRETGRWVYRNIDQGLVDGAVNGSGAAAEGSGGILRLITSGRISQYGALLFGAAAVGALVLVLTV
jgi:NADH-quinone oxidoreductase subunit L